MARPFRSLGPVCVPVVLLGAMYTLPVAAEAPPPPAPGTTSLAAPSPGTTSPGTTSPGTAAPAPGGSGPTTGGPTGPAPGAPPGAGAMPAVPAITPPVSSGPPPVNQPTPARERYGPPRNPIIGGPVSVDLTRPLTLERAIQIALQEHNSIAVARLQADVAHARLTQAKANYYPQISPTYQYQTLLSPRKGISASGVPTGTQEISSTSRSSIIAAQELLYDSGKREATVGLNRHSVYSAEYNLGNERQLVILTVTSDYYDLLRTRELERVEAEAVRRAQTTLEAIRAQVEVGSAAQSDTLQAEADVSNAQVSLLIAQNNTRLADASLRNAMGVVTSSPLILAGEHVPAPSLVPDTRDIDSYLTEAYTRRLDVKQLAEQITAQGYAVRIARINNGLTLTSNITEAYQLQPTSGEARELTIGVSYPLFNGGLTRAAVRESKAALEQDWRDLDQLQQNIHLDLEQSYVTREQARQRIAAAQTAVTAGQTNYDVALEKQRNGLINILDVITAEGQLVDAEVSLVQAIYDFYIADARVTRDIGVNDPAYVPSVPGEKPARAAGAPAASVPAAGPAPAPTTPAPVPPSTQPAAPSTQPAAPSTQPATPPAPPATLPSPPGTTAPASTSPAPTSPASTPSAPTSPAPASPAPQPAPTAPPP